MRKRTRVLGRVVIPAMLGSLGGPGGVVLGMLVAALVGAVRGWHKPRGFARHEAACCLALASAIGAGLVASMCWLAGWPLALLWGGASLALAREPGRRPAGRQTPVEALEQAA